MGLLSVIHNWNPPLKPYQSPLRTYRVKNGHLSVIGLKRLTPGVRLCVNLNNLYKYTIKILAPKKKYFLGGLKIFFCFEKFFWKKFSEKKFSNFFLIFGSNMPQNLGFAGATKIFKIRPFLESKRPFWSRFLQFLGP